MSNILKIIFIFSIYINLSLCSSEENQHGGRLFRNAYTSTVVTSKVVTSLVPSSCVQVAATLPPCRNVRYLRFPKLPSITFNHPDNKEVITNWKTEDKIETTALGWGEYLGLYAPTVTVTTTNLHISTIQDPSVVVTFAVKGCRPLKLPMDLDRCPEEVTQNIPLEHTLQTSTFIPPVVPTETLLPTKTMSAIKPSSTTVINELNNLSEAPDKQSLPENSNLLEPSPLELQENGSVQPTEVLN